MTRPSTRRATILARALAFYTLVVLAALAFNRGIEPTGIPFFVACLVLPLLGGQTQTLALVFKVGRQGWFIALLLAVGIVLGLYALLLAVTSYRGTLFLQPHADEVARVLLNSALTFIPIALAEEFFFRGYLQETAFANVWNGRGWGGLSFKNLAAALLFGLAHPLALDWLPGVLTLFGGLLLGWLVERSARSILPAVFLHAAYKIAFAWFVLLWNLNVYPAAI